jgi:hypothetical protein
MDGPFSRDEVESILRGSEGHAGPGGGQGHAVRRHLLLSNAELVARYAPATAHRRAEWERDRDEADRRGARRPRYEDYSYVLITAFTDLASMIEAGLLVMNSPAFQQALRAAFRGEAAENGAKLVARFSSGREFRMRYVLGGQGTGVMPTPHLRLVAFRDQGLPPRRLSILTFYGEMPLDGARTHCTLYRANGAPFATYIG